MPATTAKAIRRDERQLSAVGHLKPDRQKTAQVLPVCEAPQSKTWASNFLAPESEHFSLLVAVRADASTGQSGAVPKNAPFRFCQIPSGSTLPPKKAALEAKLCKAQSISPRYVNNFVRIA